jgi:hypothetical protein
MHICNCQYARINIIVIDSQLQELPYSDLHMCALAIAVNNRSIRLLDINMICVMHTYICCACKNDKVHDTFIIMLAFRIHCALITT